MKKTLIHILAIVMIFSSFGSVLAYEADKLGNDRYIEEVQLISDFGLVDDTFDADADMTRAEFIKIVSGIMFKDITNYAKSPFLDVTKETTGYNEICAAYENGYISGNEKGEFCPNNSIKYNDAVTILVTMLGYKPVAEFGKGYPDGFLSLASTLKLTKGVSVEDGNALKSCEAAKLIINTLKANICLEIYRGVGGISYTQSDVTLMEEKLNIAKHTGILESNAHTTLLQPVTNDRNEIVIGGISGGYYHSTGAEDYIGYSVDAYVRINDDGSRTFLSIAPSKYNDVEEFDADGYISFIDGRLRFADSNNRAKYVEILPSTSVIYNGKVDISYPADIFDIADGTVRIIDNDSNNSVDVVVITEYEDFAVTGKNTLNKVISARYGKQLDLENSGDERSIIILDEEGNRLSFDDIAEDTVITAVVSEDKTYVRGWVSTKIVEGDFGGRSMEDELYIITIGSESYTVSGSFPESEVQKITTGSGSAFINIFGEMAAYDADSLLYDYALIINAYYDQTTDTGCIKLMKSSGAIRTYPVYEKARKNGERINRNVWDSTLRIDAMFPKNEVIIFKLNSAGEIAKIETKDGTVLNALTERTTMTYWGGNQAFSDSLYVGTTVPIMLYPDPSDTTGEYGYSVTTADKYYSTDAATVQGFNTNPKSFLPDIVVMMDGEYLLGGRVNYNSNKYVFEKITQELNVHGETTYYIYCTNITGGETKLELRATGVYDRLVRVQGRLKRGDLFAVSRIDGGVVDSIDKYFDYDTKTVPSSSMFYSGSNFKPATGYIYEIKNDVVGISTSVNPTSVTELLYFKKANIPVYIISDTGVGGFECRKSTVDELSDGVRDGAPTKVLRCMVDRGLREIVVFEEVKV